MMTLTFASPQHGITLYDSTGLKYASGQPYRYANTKAPKGGMLSLSSIGAFTKFNPLTLQGRPAPGLNLVFESLMDASVDPDEPFSQYGLLAESVELARNRLAIFYHLNPKATFSDGVALTSDDVVFSFELLKDPACNPFYRDYYSDVDRVEKKDAHTVVFYFKKYNQELPLILGELMILPRHIYGIRGKVFGRDFDLIPPVGSGPYVVKMFDPAKFIHYQRNPRYWGNSLSVNLGRYNFDEIVFKIFLDPLTEREAIKSGLVDARAVTSAKDWALEYQGFYFQKGAMIKARFPHNRVAGMQGYAFNLRKPIFNDIHVRKALSAMLDFDRMNETLFYHQYRRQVSFFDHHKAFLSRGPAMGDVRLTLIQLQHQYGRGAVPDDAIFRGPYNIGEFPKKIAMPDRVRLTSSYLDQVGWLYDPKLKTRRKGGQILQFRILIDDPSWVRIVNPFIEALAQIGVHATYELLQPADYARRVDHFDADMIVANFPQSLSPGNEQRDFWSSKAADTFGSRNFIGIKNPAVDDVIERLINSKSRQSLVTNVQVLDRILCAHFWVIPHWYIDADRAVYWNKFSAPKVYADKAGFEGNLIQWWWWDAHKAKLLK